jgi:hypothetical protein
MTKILLGLLSLGALVVLVILFGGEPIDLSSMR